MPSDFYQFYIAYGGPNYNDFDFCDAFDLDDIGDGSAEFHRVLRELAQRASDSGRGVKLGLWKPEYPLLAVEFPAGDTSRHVFIHRSNYSLFQDISFEAHEFLTRYDAIWNKNIDTVEVRVEWADRSCLFRYLDGRESKVIDHSSGAQLRLGLSSSAAQALLGHNSTPTMTLTLAGAKIGSAAEAAAKLETIGTAFLFQVSLADGDLCSLVEIPSGDERSARYAPVNDTYEWSLELAFPQRTLEPKPLALYYYASTLSDVFPLLKFLAYYQILEYHFRRYSRARLNAARSLRSLMLRDEFDSSDIRDVTRIVDHVVAKTRRRGYGSEREQLQTVITECVDQRSLRMLLTDHRYDGVALWDHLANPERLRWVKVLDVTRRNNRDFRPTLANRIYDIRNRIVHAKESFDEEPIFPFSEESKALGPEIEVLRYIAAAVLIKSATSIT